MNQDIKIGVSQIEITPKDKNMLIAGSLHTRDFNIMKDPLFVKTIVIASGGTKIAIITLDLISISSDENIIKIKKEIHKTIGIHPNNILICPSHTHSGPYTDTILFEHPFPVLEKEKVLHTEYMEKIYKKMIESVNIANDSSECCKLGIVKGKVEGISHNRRVIKGENDCWNTWLISNEAEWDSYPAAGPIDTDLNMLVAVTKNENVKAILYNYALHANSNRTAKSVSADYPAYVQNRVAKELGAQVMTLFTPGACGNINRIHPYDCDYVGEKIGEEIIGKIADVDFNVKPSFCSKSVEVELPGRNIPEGSDTHFQEEEIKRKWPIGFEFFQNRYDRLRKEKQLIIKASLTGIRISDDIALITNPSEFFTELGMEIKKLSPFKHTIVIELTNGWIGYVPTKEAFKKGGYETFYGASFVEPEAGDIIVQESLNILKDLKNSNKLR